MPVVLARPSRLIVSLCLCAVLLAACGGGGGKKGKGTTPPRVQQLVVKTANLKAGSTDIETAGPLVGIANPTGALVLRNAQKYLDSAIFAPLASGKIGTGYAALFDPSVRGAAAGSDARALTDVGVAKVTAYTETATPVAFTGLVDVNGSLLYVATNFNVKVKATTASGPVTILHNIELTFAPGPNKSWLISAYRVHTTRTVPRTAQSTASTTESTVSKP
jgi:hypothetical protein